MKVKFWDVINWTLLNILFVNQARLGENGSWLALKSLR